MSNNRVTELNRQAQNQYAAARQVMEVIPQDAIVAPNQQQAEDLARMISTIRNKALRTLFVNLIVFIFVILSAINFYYSDTYLLMVTDAGHVKFIKQFSSILLYIFNVTKFIQEKLPFAYNTIGLVVPTYTRKVVFNFMRNPVGTIDRYKTLGLKKMNVVHMSALAAGGIALDTGSIAGSSVISTVIGMSTRGIKEFLSRAEGMSERELLRMYGTVDTFDMVKIRDYIKGLSADVLRNAIIACASIAADNATRVTQSVRVLTATNQQLMEGLERANLPLARLHQN